MFIHQNFRVTENRRDPLHRAQFLASSNIIECEFRRDGVYRERHLPGGELWGNNVIEARVSLIKFLRMLTLLLFRISTTKAFDESSPSMKQFKASVDMIPRERSKRSETGRGGSCLVR
jgi:hypothetical protein